MFSFNRPIRNPGSPGGPQRAHNNRDVGGGAPLANPLNRNGQNNNNNNMDAANNIGNVREYHTLLANKRGNITHSVSGFSAIGITSLEFSCSFNFKLLPTHHY